MEPAWHDKDAEAEGLTLTVVPAETGRETAPDPLGLTMVRRASAETRLAGKATSAEGAGASSDAALRCLRGKAALPPDREHTSRKISVRLLVRYSAEERQGSESLPGTRKGAP